MLAQGSGPAPRSPDTLPRGITPSSHSWPQEACSSKPSCFLVTRPHFLDQCYCLFSSLLLGFHQTPIVGAICLLPFSAAASVWLIGHTSYFTRFLILGLSPQCSEIDEISFHQSYFFFNLDLCLFSFSWVPSFFSLVYPSSLYWSPCVTDFFLLDIQRVHRMCSGNSRQHLLVLRLSFTMCWKFWEQEFFHYCPGMALVGRSSLHPLHLCSLFFTHLLSFFASGWRRWWETFTWSLKVVSIWF